MSNVDKEAKSEMIVWIRLSDLPHLRKYVEASGPHHCEDCPGDDTCHCCWKPTLDAVNRVCKADAEGLKPYDAPPQPDHVGEGEGLKYSPGGVPYVVPPCTCTAMARNMHGHSHTCPAHPGNCLSPHGMGYSCRYCHAASDKWFPCEHCYPSTPPAQPEGEEKGNG